MAYDEDAAFAAAIAASLASAAASPVRAAPLQQLAKLLQN